MNQKSGISLGVTLQLLRNAKKLSYDQILREELIVTRNIIVLIIINFYLNKSRQKAKTSPKPSRARSKMETLTIYSQINYKQVRMKLPVILNPPDI